MGLSVSTTTQLYDANAVPPQAWWVPVVGGLLHSKVFNIGSIPGAVQGSRLSSAPNVNANAVIRKQWDLSNGRFGIQADARYSGSVHWDLGNTPTLIEPSYSLLNASADDTFDADGQYQLTVWGKNLTETQYCNYRNSNAGLGFGDIVECAPTEGTRFLGASVRVGFR